MADTERPQLPNGWSQHALLVLETLEEHGERLKGLDEKLTDLRVDIATLKGKAAAWGAVSGAIFGGLLAIVTALIVRAM